MFANKNDEITKTTHSAQKTCHSKIKQEKKSQVLAQKTGNYIRKHSGKIAVIVLLLLICPTAAGIKSIANKNVSAGLSQLSIMAAALVPALEKVGMIKKEPSKHKIRLLTGMLSAIAGTLLVLGKTLLPTGVGLICIAVIGITNSLQGLLSKKEA